ncbi:unnamed protein product [Calicophoron daubneyi]|uniref:Adenosine 5'-monophosphoramidase HINT3 n=1 Tax=Calicophoron daubneyi TaxID=300641 RepID=A0AAV2TIS5_CALDB
MNTRCDYDMDCKFCKIARGESATTRYRYQSKNALVIDDYSPKAHYHYLCIPKIHIRNMTYLSPRDIPLLEEMWECANAVLNQLHPGTNQFLVGFHHPPYNSEHHLHLHIIGPASQAETHYLFRYPVFQPTAGCRTSQNEYNPIR